MKSVTKSKLKAKMFEYFRAVERTAEPLIITDFGKPVLAVVPYQEGQTVEAVFASTRGKVKNSRKALLESSAREWEEI